MFSRFRLLSAYEHLGLWGCGLMALVSAIGITEEPLAGTLGLLFFGGGCAFLVFEWRRLAAEEVVRDVSDFARQVSRYDIAGYERLVQKVEPLRGRRAAGVLVELSGCARLMDGLFFHARRREIGGLPELGGEPLNWALASLNPDGYVRAAAVAEMGRTPRPEFVPFLVERAVERVDAVRSAALSVLREMLADEAARVQIARSFSRVTNRRHAGGLAELLGPGQGKSGLGRCTEAAFALCGSGFRRCVVDEQGGAGPSLAPVCCGKEGRLGQSCQLVVRHRRRWAREQSAWNS
ncbi:HEAT repeat domain-containing protein [Streptomyces sp. NPDC059378]|uniref:HEAT repeat domain-containing protein n=1 Tax=Streptomyces sp. NPDC059378 TaxID=3346815 RepID=UPI00369C8F2F